MRKKKVPKSGPTEGYMVSFSYQDPTTGFWKRGKEVVMLHMNNCHQLAENFVVGKYKDSKIPVRIISVVYL